MSKDPGSPTISVNIGGTCIDKPLLDLGASVNLLPYSVYKQLGLGELNPTNITLSLANRSVKIPKGIVEDVLVKVDKFYYPVDFVVLDTELMAESINQVAIILGRPFLATSNAIINCRNGVMQLTFGNMTLELNIFHLSNNDKPAEDEEQKSEEVCLSGTSVGKNSTQKLQEEVTKNQEVVNEGLTTSITLPASVIPPAPPESRMLNTKEQKLNLTAENDTASKEELLILDPPRNLLGVQQGVVPAGTWKSLQILMGFLLYIISSFKLGFSLISFNFQIL